MVEIVEHGDLIVVNETSEVDDFVFFFNGDVFSFVPYRIFIDVFYLLKKRDISINILMNVPFVLKGQVKKRVKDYGLDENILVESFAKPENYSYKKEIVLSSKFGNVYYLPDEKVFLKATVRTLLEYITDYMEKE